MSPTWALRLSCVRFRELQIEVLIAEGPAPKYPKRNRDSTGHHEAGIIFKNLQYRNGWNQLHQQKLNFCQLHGVLLYLTGRRALLAAWGAPSCVRYHVSTSGAWMPRFYHVGQSMFLYDFQSSLNTSACILGYMYKVQLSGMIQYNIK